MDIFFSLYCSFKSLNLCRFDLLCCCQAGGLNTLLFMEPSPSPSAELVSNQFPKTTDANLKGATRYTAAQKKRLADKAYRERCKELKMNTMNKLDELTIENDRLRRENDSLKNEEVLLVQTLQRQKDEMKQLEKEFGQLKGQLNSQNMVVEVLLKQLVSVSPFSSFAVCYTKLLTFYKQP
uniref:BZIP domain-containing protein n=1 Tax=Populus davidiana TaxID=266767 RepID=A0A6M2ERM4_9ROSI